MKFGVGFFYGWIYILVFGLINLILMKVYPKHYTKRLFTLPAFTNVHEKILSIIYAIMFNMTMIAACFLPISNGMLLIAGLIIYTISIVCIVVALCMYALTEPSKPVTKGIYRLSRHPQQVFSCFMLVGIGISLANLIIVASGLIQLLLLYPSMLAQERFCIEKYGKDYENYISTVPRYFLGF